MIQEMELLSELGIDRALIKEMCHRLGVVRLELCSWDPSFNDSEDELLFMAHLNNDPNRSGFTFVRVEEELALMTGRPVYVRTSGERNMSGNFDAPETVAVLFDAN